MRKILIYLIASSCWGGILNAQSSYYPFPDSNAHWYTDSYISEMGGRIPFFTHYFFNGDTIIGSNTYHKIYDASGVASPPPSDSLSILLGFMRSDSLKKTYFLYNKEVGNGDTIEHKIYDFSLTAGDTMIDQKYDGGTYIPYYVVIDSIKEVPVVHETRRAFFVTLIAQGRVDYPPSQIWIEGVGSTGVPASRFYYNFDGSNASLCEYIYRDTVIYQLDNSCFSSFTTDNALIRKNNIVISPNPSFGEFSIKNFSSFSQLNFSVFNSEGQKVADGVLNMSAAIDLTKLATGVYVIKLSEPEGQFAIKKVVKE